MRAFYVADEEVWDAEPIPEVLEVSRGDGVVNLIAPMSPYPPLEAVGALRLGTRLSELAAPDAAHFTTSLVRREGPEGPQDVRVPSTDIDPGETVVPGSDAPRAVFAGDDPADYR